MWWNIIPVLFKTGAEIYKNQKQSELLESEAERRYYERMARGEIEYTREIGSQQDKSWKDEFVLLVVCLATPIQSTCSLQDIPYGWAYLQWL